MSDVNLSDNTILIESGLYDTTNGVKLQVVGDAYPRVHITPQGTVKTGNGTAAPVATTTYTPAVSGDWDPVPTTIAGALDQLADRVAALE